MLHAAYPKVNLTASVYGTDTYRRLYGVRFTSFAYRVSSDHLLLFLTIHTYKIEKDAFIRKVIRRFILEKVITIKYSILSYLLCY